VQRVRNDLLFLADPVSSLSDLDDDTLAGYTLGELYHARLVLMRWLRVFDASS